ncbi:protein NYNRIN-like [Ranitomeya variabilis]|uniref:protein NYNRIN-like n=1 Tax=Ranitomeya variabilis TaxID=490064 RepID=UPI004056B4F1
MYEPDGTVKLTAGIPESALCTVLACLHVTDSLSPPEADESLAQVPDVLWAKSKTDIGHMPVPPVMINLKPGAQPPQVRQYPLSSAQEEAIGKNITDLIASGAIKPTKSVANTPLFPVKKKGRKGEPVTYRMVHDLRAINAVTELLTPVVPNPHTIMSQIPTTAACFSCIDLANAYFSVPLHQDCQYLFAFTFRGQQYTWMVLPQGAHNSPTLYTAALQLVLQDWIVPHAEVVLLQYVDDLLLCAPNRDVCCEATISLLLHLASKGCKASREKLQFCQLKVVFLGHCISQGARHLTEDRKKAIQLLTPPTGVQHLRTFLGLASYCRPWIRSASILMQPLYDCLPTQPFLLSQEALDSFYSLKLAIVSAPALGTPDYAKLFLLYCTEMQGHATGVLAQKHGQQNRPVAYYSARLDPVARGAPSCVRAVAAVSLLLDKASEIVLDYQVTVYTPHDLHSILSQVQPKHIAVARHLRLQCALLMPPNVTLKRCMTLNPATLIPIDVVDSKGGEKEIGQGKPLFLQNLTEEELFDAYHEHDCIALMAQETAGFSHVSDVPLTNPDVELFVDGSRSIGEDGRFYTGYAVVTQHEVVKAEPLPPHMSAQEAELTALIEALKGAEGKRYTIYTDSRYGFGVAHDYGPIWRARDFLTSTGTPIKHGHLIKQLMDALLLPKEVAIVKVKAHTRLATNEARGNDKADRAAKEAARKPRRHETPAATPLIMVSTECNQLDLSILQALTRQATGEEKKVWSKAGAQEHGGLWKVGQRVCLPRSLYPAMAQAAHGPTHLSKNGMCALVEKQWVAPGFTMVATRFTQACLTCAQHNPGSVVKVPQKHTPKPLYPFQRLQIDFIQLPKVGTYEYCLVCVDLFSGWPEAFPMPKATARATAKKLMSEVFCRFGLPETIESDRGTHFTGETQRAEREPTLYSLEIGWWSKDTQGSLWSRGLTDPSKSSSPQPHQ